MLVLLSLLVCTTRFNTMNALEKRLSTVFLIWTIYSISPISMIAIQISSYAFRGGWTTHCTSLSVWTDDFYEVQSKGTTPHERWREYYIMEILLSCIFRHLSGLYPQQQQNEPPVPIINITHPV